MASHVILSSFLQEGTSGGDLPGAEGPDPQLRAGHRGLGEEVTLTYTVPMPSDGAVSESAPVLDFVQSGPLQPRLTESTTHGAPALFHGARARLLLQQIDNTLNWRGPLSGRQFPDKDLAKMVLRYSEETSRQPRNHKVDYRQHFKPALSLISLSCRGKNHFGHKSMYDSGNPFG